MTENIFCNPQILLKQSFTCNFPPTSFFVQDKKNMIKMKGAKYLK